MIDAIAAEGQHVSAEKERPMMKPRSIAANSLLAGFVFLGVTPATAQNYPARYVRIVTGSAGTFHDLVARHLAQQLGERWGGHGVIVENQPGAGLTIGTSLVANAQPDGYTLLLGDRTALAVAPSMHKN